MMKLQTLFLLLATGFMACKGNPDNSASEKQLVITDTQKTGSVIDTASKFDTDDYPVTMEMLLKQTRGGSYLVVRSGETISLDKAWFRNDTLNQTLVFALATDFHRFEIFHFFTNDIPDDLIKRIALHVDGGELQTEEKKRTDFKGFLKQAARINSSFFVSNKGLKLGDVKKKAIELYGEPDKQTAAAGLEKWEWSFEGDMAVEGRIVVKEKPLAKNSFGHGIEMYFRDGKLIGHIIFNDIP